MSEDERYRTSTQYRLWSYSPDSLLDLRSTTNRIAAERVREAVRRVREARALSSADTSEVENGRPTSAIPEGEVDCLTVDEELKLVAFYCRQTIQLGDHLKVPTDVKVWGDLARDEEMMLIVEGTGYGDTVHQTLLHHEFADDLSSR
jgi:cyclin H